MLRIITILLIGTASVCADGFIYTSDDDQKHSKNIENGELVIRAPLKKVEITHVVLKQSPDHKNVFWLSFHMKESKSIGLLYYFKPKDDNNRDSQFYHSPSEFHKDGCSWSYSIESLEEGRRILKLVREAYKLDEKHAIDKIKG